MDIGLSSAAPQGRLHLLDAPGRARSLGASVVAMVACSLWSTSARAQTWEGGRTGPTLGEIVAVDATGEPDWPFGAEDVAGDGLDQFQQSEQSIDMRSAYATAGGQDLWVRLYVSDPNAPGGNVTAYLFIDSDRNGSTGGTDEAIEIDSRFTPATTTGGYEYVLAVGGNENVIGVWAWEAAQNQFVDAPSAPAQATAEVGTDLDPLRLGANDHGYLQVTIALNEVGLTNACNADLFWKTVDEAGTLGDGDLEVGLLGPCIPADANGDQVPDLVVPSAGCQSDIECPGSGVCIAGQCRLAPPCSTDGDCANDETCIAGRCVALGGDTCTSDADCGDLVCIGGQCAACTATGADCGPGRSCGPDGRCVDDTGATDTTGGEQPALEPGEEVRGGAGTCAAGSGRDPSGVSWLGATLVGLLCWRRRRRHASTKVLGS